MLPGQEGGQPRHAANVIASTAGDDQPSAGASMNAKVMPVRNTTAAGARVIDRPPCAGSRDSGTCRAPSATTAAAMGTLMKKIHRQDAAEIR